MSFFLTTQRPLFLARIKFPIVISYCAFTSETAHIFAKMLSSATLSYLSVNVMRVTTFDVKKPFSDI